MQGGNVTDGLSAMRLNLTTELPDGCFSEKHNPLLQIVIEIPKGSFLKRGSTGHLDFISPFPCPFNYGSVPGYLGGEGDLLDAVVLGPKLRQGQTVYRQAWGSVGLHERFMYDDKLICSVTPLTPTQKQRVLQFFHFYARCKGILNILRGQRGKSWCAGWGDARTALARATPINSDWTGPDISF